MNVSVWVGFDPREAAAYGVCRYSLQRRLTIPTPVRGVILDNLRDIGIYWRPTEIVELPNGAVTLVDVISEHPMSTQFAISRFLTPYLARERQAGGWAVFMDCDIMALDNLARMFDLFNPQYAVMCVKHNHQPRNTVKMDGQIQTRYSRKNWSSVMAFNLDHPANAALTVELINEVPGRDLHAFCWLGDDADSLIGELPARWNYLVGHTELAAGERPALVHFTDGYPLMSGYGNVEHAQDFLNEMRRWAE